MTSWVHLKNWPLRWKVAALLFVASLAPLAIVSWISVHNARRDALRGAETALAASADILAQRIDAINDGYRLAVQRMAHIPDALDLLQAKGRFSQQQRARLNQELQVLPDSDSRIRGAAVLDTSGTVVAGTEPALLGVNLDFHSFVRKALAGSTVISDVYLSEPEVGEAATFAYLSAMRATNGKVIGAVAIWVNAALLSEVISDDRDRAGSGSFGVLLDGLGIRIAHAFNADVVLRPARPLSQEQVDALVAERRFGSRTREILRQDKLAGMKTGLSATDLPDATMFHAFAPVLNQWAYAVGRRLKSVPWRAYYLLPEATVDSAMSRVVRQKLAYAVAITTLALLVGTWFAAIMLRPLEQLRKGARAIGEGNLHTRLRIDRTDELGELGTEFNQMAARLEELSARQVSESEAQYRKLFETLSEPFCIVEVIFDAGGEAVDFLILEHNEEFAAQSGLGNARGKRRGELLPQTEHFWTRVYGEVAKTGKPAHVEGESKRLKRFFNVRAYRIGGPDSRRVAVLFNDITERRQTQRRQQAQLERLNLLNQITRAIGERRNLNSIFQVVLDELEQHLPIDFGCICLSEPEHELERLLVTCTGRLSQEVAQQMGLRDDAHIPIDENGLTRCVLGHLLYEPQLDAVHLPFPQQLARAGLGALVAAPLQVESKAFGVLFAARRAGGFSSGDCEFLLQLSQHVALAAHQSQLNAALQEAYENLHKSQQAALQQERLRALGQMASGIAHDINNAISPIQLYTDSLLEREQLLSTAGRAQLQIIQRAVQDVTATVSRMRDFYRTREPQLPLEPVQLNDLVQQVAELTRPRWSTQPQQHGITIEQVTELDPGLPTILGSENEIRVALTNLVFNAVDAMPNGGRLTLRTHATGFGQIEVEVRDTGIGMDEDARRRCLEPFFTTKGQRGTGLGLAMVYGMAQRHGADIQIDSAPGNGTSVTLRFDAAGRKVPEAQTAPAPTMHGLRVLIVDDDPVLLRTLRAILEADAHTVIAADGGQQGIDIARAALANGERFSIAITDLGMPHIDGREVARALKALAPAMPVVLLTGWGQRLVSEGEVPPHVDLVLSKPPKLRDLRAALASLCAGQSLA